MRIKIKLHPNSSQEKINKISEDEYEVWIKEKPIDGKANEELVKILKKYFKKQVEIVKGFKSREKIVEISE
jgi:uncharacterized protein (TIGR00251 family)